MDGFLNKLKSLDAYPKVNEDFFQRTLSGGIITIGSSLLMIMLFLSELSAGPLIAGLPLQRHPGVLIQAVAVAC